MLKLQAILSLRYKQKSMNIKVLDNRQSISHWMILLLCPALRSQMLSHLARNTKAMEYLVDPQEPKTITKKVTSICLVRNSCQSTQKRRFKLSCLDILNSFCLMLLTFPSIHTMEVIFEH